MLASFPSLCPNTSFDCHSCVYTSLIPFNHHHLIHHSKLFGQGVARRLVWHARHTKRMLDWVCGRFRITPIVHTRRVAFALLQALVDVGSNLSLPKTRLAHYTNLHGYVADARRHRRRPSSLRSRFVSLCILSPVIPLMIFLVLLLTSPRCLAWTCQRLYNLVRRCPIIIPCLTPAPTTL